LPLRFAVGIAVGVEINRAARQWFFRLFGRFSVWD